MQSIWRILPFHSFSLALFVASFHFPVLPLIRFAALQAPVSKKRRLSQFHERVFSCKIHLFDYNGKGKCIDAAGMDYSWHILASATQMVGLITGMKDAKC
ncbi:MULTISPECIES: hypothetical protein [Brevibacillus]|uniref:hypothetical protein n=1 Tax=Brevibacillus TaxID=55080 RepID=UPI001561CE6A|nr:hypothetical protein [Brevibacillus borstelensis]MBE5394906.1 hypothetical protein [Brevibacillus borstelensis]MCM3469344.1 hypothetical protein [Brevibacillus borstelensis]MCM3622374.1 hypothetical protein [Brevibacillus borstelensis]MED1745368.1 hypothetical protein [Brevibacillus borstelensis]MED1875717.1 hypothetical protein [Brevibacillus borstelensis]